MEYLVFKMEDKENILDKVILKRESDEPDEVDKEDVAKIIKEWLSKNHIHLKTELNQNQIYAVTVLMTLAKQYNIKPLKKLVNNFLMYMLSKGRKSSSELVDILKSRTAELDDNGLGNLAKFLD
jgi:hypothetical protein